ncbi:hypothetical protein [Streptomyces sp. NPDC050355]|uniref:hypothetical protein n=1 Tax=Streptomyces sp. NPDC050355 TaxID=3365609 RepID=UPI0037B9F474
MGIKDQFQDKANELRDQANQAASGARANASERGRREEQERGRRQGGQERDPQRDRGQQGRRTAQDALDDAEGRYQS